MSGAPPSGRAAGLRPQPQAASRSSIPDAERAQRWFRRWDKAPRDGTAFSVPIIYRHNPFAERWEVLAFDPETGARGWLAAANSVGNEPNWWCPLLPLSFDLPNKEWFAVEYTATLTAKQKTRRSRFRDWLWTKLPELERVAAVVAWMVPAQAMSASGQDPQGLGAKPASAVRGSECAQTPSISND